MDEGAATKPQIATFGHRRFAPGAYTLDLSQVASIPVTMNGQQSTFIEVLRFLQETKIKEMPGWSTGEVYVTETGDIVLKPAEDDHWLLTVLKKLLEIVQAGTNIDLATWFYYEVDWSCDGNAAHVFFVTDGDKVVSEQVHFSDFEPLILKKKREDEPIWHSHPYLDEAWEIYWYRKFYSETLRGQLMLLRPDQPPLYHYERPAVRDVTRDLEFVTLLKMYRLIWVAIPLLAAIAFPTISVYMGLVAIVLAIDVLWRCWATRNVGKG